MKYTVGKSLSIIALSAALAACGGSDSDSTSTGSLSLGLTDAPVDSLQKVVITFTGVSIKPADGEAISFQFDAPKELNLLEYQGGNAAGLLDNQSVAAGQYEWVRLDLSNQQSELYVIDDGGLLFDLFVPSGTQTGLKLVSGFTVPAGGSADFTIDFDVRKSVTYPNEQNRYILKPALRLIDNVEAGSIAGIVDFTNYVQAECTSVSENSGLMYVFEGADIVPDDFDATDPEALMAVPVADEDNDGFYTYKAAFLLEGDYTLAYTCGLDDLEANDALSFLGTTNVTVVAKEEATLNFE